MATNPLSTMSTVPPNPPEDLAQWLEETRKLTLDQEKWCDLVAHGCTFHSASLEVGVSEATGRNWAKIPEIKARVVEIVEGLKTAPESADLADSAYIVNQLLAIRDGLKAADDEERANLVAQRDTLMAVARLRGLIVEKRQTAQVKVNLAGLGTADLEGLLGQLPEGRRRKLLGPRPPKTLDSIPTSPEE